MLTSLSIRDIVLIERLDLSFAPGLTVLTGETGAGKSIILDALGLVLGARADRSLVRAGSNGGSVAASFQPPANHPAWSVLDEQEIPADGEIFLRRTLASDGRSRAFVNDEPISGQLMRRLGDALVEVHGQHDQKGLLSTAAHRALLDAYGGHDGLTLLVREAHRALAKARHAHAALEEEVAAARREEEYLRHRAQELADLAPERGEDEALAAQRQLLMNREKLATACGQALDAISGGNGARDRLAQAERKLERLVSLAPELLTPALDALSRSVIELVETDAVLESALRELDLDANALERIEARLFALRDASRKHRVPVDELPALLEETEGLLGRIDHASDAVDASRREIAAAERTLRERVLELRERRHAAAATLADAVQAELPPLKLERARFRVSLDELSEEEWGTNGGESVSFEIRTNPGQAFGPLHKVASGGELSRLMLALKVVLARVDAVETLIFDEVDAGIGGATADAAGDRLARLANERQILVVTHTPQIAARADNQLTVRKRVVDESTSLEVRALGQEERRDELARMLAGAEVTPAARAAAQSLLDKAARPT